MRKGGVAAVPGALSSPVGTSPTPGSCFHSASGDGEGHGWGPLHLDLQNPFLKVITWRFFELSGCVVTEHENRVPCFQTPQVAPGIPAKQPPGGLSLEKR